MSLGRGLDKRLQERPWPDNRSLASLGDAWRQISVEGRRDLTVLGGSQAVAMYQATRAVVASRASSETSSWEAGGRTFCMFRTSPSETVLKDCFLKNPRCIEMLAQKAVKTVRRKDLVVDGARGKTLKGHEDILLLRGPEEETVESLEEFFATLVLHNALSRKAEARLQATSITLLLEKVETAARSGRRRRPKLDSLTLNDATLYEVVGLLEPRGGSTPPASLPQQLEGRA